MLPVPHPRPARSLWLLVVLFASLVALSSTGCSVLLDFTECESANDCQGLEGGPWTCGSDNTCVQVSSQCTVDDDCVDQAPRTMCMAGTCVAPTDTIDDTSMPDMMSDTSDVPSDVIGSSCTTHSDCRDANPDTFCQPSSGMCVSAVTEECPHYEFPTGSENVVFIGSIIPTQPPYDSLALPLQQALQLAIADFNAAGGLPGGRKIAWVGCDSQGSSEIAQRGARHLVDTLAVPAIVGPVLSTNFIDVVTNVTAAAGVFAITPTATSADITGLDALAWRNISSDVFQVNAFVDRIEALGSSKVVVLARDDAYGNGLLSGSIDPLTALLGESNVEFSNYPDPVTLSSTDEIIDEFSTVVSSAIAAAPDADTVVLYGLSEAVDLMKIYLVGLNSAGISPPAPPPRFIFSHGAIPVLPRAVEETSDALLPLVEGISPQIFDEENILKFRTRFAARYQVEPLNSASLAYDATFVVLFSMSSLERNADITGQDVATGIASLIDGDQGTVISFGDENFISTARTVLGNGMTVDLRGVSSHLDFDLSTHELRMDYLGWGVAKNGAMYDLLLQRVYALDPPPSEQGTWVDL